jgi:acetyl-CoA carboxylase carboxyltransferase component
MSAQSKLDKVAEMRGKALGATPARERLALLFDADSFVELDGFVTVDGGPSGVVCGYGAVAGSPVYAFAQDSTENGGAVGYAHAAKILKIYDLALKTGAPVVGIYDSHGARVLEGAGRLPSSPTKKGGKVRPPRRGANRKLRKILR